MPKNTDLLKKNILLAGGSGLVGTQITKLLLNKAYQVAWLTRSPNSSNGFGILQFGWQPMHNQIDDAALEWADAVINLSGTSVAGKAWTQARKDSIYWSRIKSTALLQQANGRVANPAQVLINASATGYYGAYPPLGTIDESVPAGTDFLAKVTSDWEAEVHKHNTFSRKVLLRIGIVLSRKGGALPQLAQTRKFGFLAPIGTAKQWMPWIHINDVASIFMFALENQMVNGVYNTTAPNPVRQNTFMKTLAKVCGSRTLVLPPVPGFLIKLAFGEMADIVLGGGCVVPQNLQQAGFKFQFNQLNEALEHLYCNS